MAGHTVEHYDITFGDPIAAAFFEISCGATDRQTDRQVELISVYRQSTRR